MSDFSVSRDFPAILRDSHVTKFARESCGRGSKARHVVQTMSNKVSPYVEEVRAHFENNKRKKDYVSHQAKVSSK